MIKKRFREYFTYTRKERNGLIVLLIILFILILIKIYQSNQSVGETVIFDSEFQAEIDSFEKGLIPKKDNKPNAKESNKFSKSGWEIPEELFYFNPNNVSSNDLIKLGLSEKQITTLINYRKKGGTFYKKKDLLKIYGIEDIQFKALEPYIKIENKDKLTEFKEEGETGIEIMLLIELNSATKEQLISIKGIGEVYANRIIKYRDLLGGYYSKNQLLEVYGLDTVKYLSISQRINIDTSLISKIDLNKANFKLLIKHPYINKYETEAILKYKEIIGEFTEFEQIHENNLLNKESFIKIKPYLRLN
ncbi:MAG: helix-hairpin-helix domain-containing protein [Bacteroidales bacterium]|nr:helix-hairpin-helix domain-containing protein [Bacteroidales bacterium]